MDQFSPPPAAQKRLLSFYDALKEALNEKLITREAWNDVNEYGFIVEERLSIKTKGAVHNWIVSTGDITATDWYVLGA